MSDEDDFHARVAAMVSREREALAPLAQLPQVEIIGVSSGMGAGALGSPRDDAWALRLVMSPWRIADGPLRHAPLFVRRVAPEAEIDALVARCEGRGLLRLRGHLQQRSDAEPAVLLLAAWLDGVVEDAELTAALVEAEAQEARAQAAPAAPSDLHDSPWGPLAWDDARERWTAEIDWAGTRVTLSLDANRVRDPQPLLATANALHASRVQWQARVRAAVEGQLLALYNDVWCDDDGPLDGPTFAARVQPFAIDVGPEGQLAFWLRDDGLFGEHDIRLSGQLDRPDLVHSLVG